MNEIPGDKKHDTKTRSPGDTSDEVWRPRSQVLQLFQWHRAAGREAFTMAREAVIADGVRVFHALIR